LFPVRQSSVNKNITIHPFRYVNVLTVINIKLSKII
jgi:hypothetical protein